MKTKKDNFYQHNPYCSGGTPPCRCMYWGITGAPADALSKKNVAAIRNARVEKCRKQKRRRGGRR